MGMHLDKRHLDVTVRRLKNARGENLVLRAVHGMEDGLGILAAETKNRMGVDTGALLESQWHGITNINPGKFEVTGKVTMQRPGSRQLPYAWIEEEGGWIFPKPQNRLQRLVWRDEHTGQLIFAKRVYHPAKHYMAGAVPAVGRQAADKMLESMTGGIFNTYD